MTTTKKPRYDLGQIITTATARSILTPEEILDGLNRHAIGDWGNICADDAAINEDALATGGLLFSVYGVGQRRFWIIAEADRSVTTILMPSDL